MQMHALICLCVLHLIHCFVLLRSRRFFSLTLSLSPSWDLGSLFPARLCMCWQQQTCVFAVGVARKLGIRPIPSPARHHHQAAGSEAHFHDVMHLDVAVSAGCCVPAAGLSVAVAGVEPGCQKVLIPQYHRKLDHVSSAQSNVIRFSQSWQTAMHLLAAWPCLYDDRC